MENTIKTIWTEIDAVQNFIFDYQINEAFSKLSVLIDDLSDLTTIKDEGTIKKINLIFNEINDAIVDKDYLMVVDLLEYKLKKVLQSGLS